MSETDGFLWDYLISALNGLENALRATADDMVKANAEFAASSGLTAKIVRSTSGKCCAWCSSIAGTYTYGSEPKDVYRRHNNCDCTVEYVTSKGSQNVHSKQWTRASEADKIRVRKTIGSEPALLKLDDISIYHSLSAKAQNYDVLDLRTGEKFRFVEGTKIQNVQAFAGKGTKTPYRNAEEFAERYGGQAADWQHVKGFGWLRTDDGDFYAEVHWSQCEEVGKVEFFVKEWLN